MPVSHEIIVQKNGNALTYLDGTGTYSVPAGSGGGGGLPPIANISGSIATTTGSVTIGTPTLTVASAAGWAVGMGIAIANREHATDSFPGSALSGNWTVGSGGFTVSGGNVTGSASSGQQNAAIYSGAVWGNDQSAKITVTTATSNGAGVFVRMSSSGGYMATFSSSAGALFKTSSYGSGYTLIANIPLGVSNGDVIRLAAIGTNLYVYINGILVYGATDSTYAGGSPGIYGGFGSGTSNSMTNFEGTSYGAEFITTISSIAGTTFTLASNAPSTLTSQIVFHDDTAALTAALATVGPVYMPAGNFNITSALTVSSPVKLEGSGLDQSIIWNRSLTSDVFIINYETTLAGGYPLVPILKGAILRDFTIAQDPENTPSAGFGFNIASASGSGHYVTGLHIEDVGMSNLFDGIKTGTGLISCWFSNIYIVNCVGGSGIYYDTPQPGGDCHFTNMEMTGTLTGLTIVHSDVTEFTNLKLNGAGIVFAAPSSAGDIAKVRFINMSLEGGGSGSGQPTYGIDFGNHGCADCQFIGGQVDLSGTTSLHNQEHCTGLQMIGVQISDTAADSTDCVITGLTSASPTSAGTAGIRGQLCWDATGLYVCTASGAVGAATWVKATLTSV